MFSINAGNIGKESEPYYEPAPIEEPLYAPEEAPVPSPDHSPSRELEPSK